MKLKTKAKTLHLLHGQLKTATVLPQLTLNLTNWTKDQLKEKLTELCWIDQSLIVRSSFASEDQLGTANAGKFLTVANINSFENLCRAIQKVSASNNEPTHACTILIQPMVKDTHFSGVAFSREPKTGAPYYMINIDHTPNVTDTVTGGKSSKCELFCLHHARGTTENPRACKVLGLLKELEALFPNYPIDIEFAQDTKENLYLFQVRPLIISRKVIPQSHHAAFIKKVERDLHISQKASNHLPGSTTFFGIMSDWNPAEIIGARPHRLALSLYKELITDRIWAISRKNYGYQDVINYSLMTSLQGIPYIDVRLSFNSLIPRELDLVTTEKLVNFYLAKLKANPQFHDRIEFEVAFSTYTFNLNQRLKELKHYDFSGDEIEIIKSSLFDLTNRILFSENNPLDADYLLAQQLGPTIQHLKTQDLCHRETLRQLIEKSQSLGSLPFAGLARGGFMAKELLESLFFANVFSKKEIGSFLASIRRPQEILFEEDNLPNLNGHLRPGTYDIIAARYDEQPDYNSGPNDFSKKHKFHPSKNQLKMLDRLIQLHKLPSNAPSLLKLIHKGIERRELSKFLYSQGVSEILVLVESIGREIGLSRNQCCHLAIQDFIECKQPKRIISRCLKEKRRYNLAKTLQLPALLTNSEDLWSHHQLNSLPTFITNKRVHGEVCHFKPGIKCDLKDKILFMECADPGYDWIFNLPIKGFVTEYGGPNSHMALRAIEAQMPAVIGCGEVLYSRWSNYSRIELNCASEGIWEIR